MGDVSRTSGSSAVLDPRATGVETSEFPILCETCLGPNPYVRMLKDKWGRPCKVCERPFTVFRWSPAGAGMRHKNTEVCQTCARVKNVCQTCLLDLQYGLPVQVRDASMAPGDRQATVVPASERSRQYTASQGDRALASGQIDAIYSSPAENSFAERNKRAGPRYDRNKAHLCSWFAKGKCSRGVYCPFRHELPKDKSHPLANQNIKDRYYGVNDPVAAAIMAKSAEPLKRPRSTKRKAQERDGPPSPPDDCEITSVFIGGITSNINEQVLRALYSDYADRISTIRIHADKKIAFIDFQSREAAESAMKDRFGPIEIADTVINVKWAKGSIRKGAKRSQESQPVSCAAYMISTPLPDISGLVPHVQPPPGSQLLADRTIPASSFEQSQALSPDIANQAEQSRIDSAARRSQKRLKTDSRKRHTEAEKDQ